MEQEGDVDEESALIGVEEEKVVVEFDGEVNFSRNGKFIEKDSDDLNDIKKNR